MPTRVPVLTGILIGILLPLVCAALEYFPARRQRKKVEAQGKRMWQTFTPTKCVRNDQGERVYVVGESVDFEPRHGHYLKCAEVLITLSSASLIFIPGLHLSVIHPWLAFLFVLLGFTVVYALSFMGLLTHFYEQFLYDPLTYGEGRMALNYGLGFGALACFAIAYFTLSILLGTTYASGGITVR